MNKYMPDPDAEPRWPLPYFGRQIGTGTLGDNAFCCRHPIGGIQYNTYAGSLRFHGRSWNWVGGN